MKTALVVGAGPAGLMAAEALSDAGLRVMVVDQKPSVARKFLMAGKSGLNLTKDEPFDDFLQAYGDSAKDLMPMLSGFGPDQVGAWARELGQDIFTGSSGRVFPKAMKASPLLRAWLARLAAKGVTLQTRFTWAGFDPEGLVFETPSGRVVHVADVVVLAMGGASWKRLGSDGEWAKHLPHTTDFKPSNMGALVSWSAFMERFFGMPVKNLAVLAGDARVRGEAVITARGLEGGAIYSVSTKFRDGAQMYFDLLPDLSEQEVKDRWNRPRGKDSLSNFLRKRFKLDPVKIALLNEFGRPLPDDPSALLKRLPVLIQGYAPMDEAISTAGGVSFDEVDKNLMLKARAGTFVAGEMLDWDAPTGGYLISACLATGLWAGRRAAEWAGQADAAL